MTSQKEGYLPQIVWFGDAVDIKLFIFLNICRLHIFAVVLRSASAQSERRGWNTGNGNAVAVIKFEFIFVNHFADNGAFQIPFGKNCFHNAFLAFFDHGKHPFLRFGEQNFPCVHVFLTQGDFGQVDFHSAAAALRHL